MFLFRLIFLRFLVVTIFSGSDFLRADFAAARLAHEATCCCVCLAPWPWRFRSFPAPHPHRGTSSRGTRDDGTSQEFFHGWVGGLMQKYHLDGIIEKTPKKSPRLRDLKTMCLWISYAETRVFGCAAASGQSEPCAKQQSMQIRVVPKHFITSLQLLDLIAKVSPWLHSARSRQMSGWKSPGQPVLRTGKDFFLFHKWYCICTDFIHFCCSSPTFTAFLMRQRNHGGSSCMPGAFAQRLVFCRLSGLVAHLLSDDAAAWCTTTMGCTWQSEGAFFKNMQLLTQNTVTMWTGSICSVCYPSPVLKVIVYCCVCVTPKNCFIGSQPRNDGSLALGDAKPCQ